MHLIIGMALSMLFSRGKKDIRPEIMDKDMGIAFNARGRLRIYSRKLKSLSVAEALKKELEKVEGIQEIGYNTITGSLLLLYDEHNIQGDLLASAVYQLLGFNRRKTEQQNSKIYTEVHAMHQAVNQALLEKSSGALDVRTLLAGVFFAFGLKELIRNKSLGLPAPILLFYWAYNALGLNELRQ